MPSEEMASLLGALRLLRRRNPFQPLIPMTIAHKRNVNHSDDVSNQVVRDPASATRLSWKAVVPGGPRCGGNNAYRIFAKVRYVRGMVKLESFGIMVSCYRGDLPLLDGCLSSLKSHFPNTPICLVTHGNFSIERYERAYGVTALREQEVDVRLREQSYGYGLTKMVSFWHSPFDRFMHIDADTVAWGNFLEGKNWDQYDFVANEPHEVITPSIQRAQYFDPDKFDVGFEWAGHPYFNTGVFIARRGQFSLNRYLELLSIQKNTPGSIFTDQGVLNIMVFEAALRGKLELGLLPLQAVVPVIEEMELKGRFSFKKGRPVINAADRRLIHWAGPKPLLSESHRFAGPMTYYRKRSLLESRSIGRFAPIWTLRAKEQHARFTAKHEGSYRRALRSKLAFFMSRLMVTFG